MQAHDVKKRIRVLRVEARSDALVRASVYGGLLCL